MTTVNGYGGNRKCTVNMMTTVNWLRGKIVNLRCRLQKVATMKLLLEKIIICSVDGEIIPVKMMCEDGCEIYVGSTCEQNSQVI